MRIGVISDTHDNIAALSVAVHAAGTVEGWIHLGDMVSDAQKLAEMSPLPVYYVKGNCDGPANAPTERVLELEGVRVFITHGHNYDVNTTLLGLLLRAKELNCAAALFGHTHKPYLANEGGVIMLNPGSATRPIGCKHPSVAVLTIENGSVNADMITF